jgi:hypothetical protein
MNKDDIAKNLEKHMPQKPVAKPKESETVRDAEEDYEYSREKFKSLIDRAEGAIDAAMGLAMEAEHPRAFEVVSQMIKNTSDMTTELMKLQKERREIHKEEDKKQEGNVTNHNAIFVGSTSELQKMLKDEVVIDAEEGDLKN